MRIARERNRFPRRGGHAGRPQSYPTIESAVLLTEGGDERTGFADLIIVLSSWGDRL